MDKNKDRWDKCTSCGKGIPPGLNMVYICPTCLIKPYTKKK